MLIVARPTGYKDVRRGGFTVVELLIVVVVIAILAAITIVSYNGIANQTYDSAVKSDLSTLAKKIELIKAEADTYPVPLTSDMSLGASKSSYQPARNNLYYCLSAAADDFALGAISKSGNGFFYVASTGKVTSGSVSGAATCSKVGQSAWDSTYTYTQLGFNQDQPGTRGWAAWLL